MKTINNDQFYKNSKQQVLNVIDVRERNEFAIGHIPKSINLPLSTLALNTKALSKEEDYYIICASGGRSSVATTLLNKFGYNVTNVEGGIAAWKGALIR
ncbi:rhodanese-like domain-containing protein [Fundicoccus sp. Sow4_D5]|uniref:rhodanese-like domain-containing protein n=1 Tax=unclassified Fundicoccus TaxID=2761543 RepID=UPI003F8E948A